jgi:hypothetical protein
MSGDFTRRKAKQSLRAAQRQAQDFNKKKHVHGHHRTIDSRHPVISKANDGVKTAQTQGKKAVAHLKGILRTRAAGSQWLTAEQKQKKKEYNDSINQRWYQRCVCSCTA